MSKLGTTRATAIVSHVTNLDLLAAHEEAEAELERLNKLTSAGERLNDPYTKQIRAQAKKVLDLEDEMEKSTVRIKLRALKRARYAEITAAHPAREDNDVDRIFGVNTDEFPDAVMPESIVEAWDKTTGEKIDFTGADWAEESEEFSDAQLAAFVSKVIKINRGSASVPFSQTASAVTRTSGGKSSKQKPSA